MAVLVIATLHLLGQKHERYVERLLAGTADPEEAMPLAVHLNQSLLERTALDHPIVHPDQQISVQRQRGGHLGLGLSNRARSFERVLHLRLTLSLPLSSRRRARRN